MTLMSGQRDHSPSLAQAVRQLRLALGETQEAFARRLQTTVRTVARYESTAPRSGLVLTRLAQIAASNRQPELAQVFQDALVAEVGEEYVRSTVDFYTETFTKPAEILAVGALVEAMRNPRHASIAAAARQALAPLMEEQKRRREQMRRAIDLSSALLAAYRQGKTDREMAAFFDLPVETVREWRRLNIREEDAKVPRVKRKK